MTKDEEIAKLNQELSDISKAMDAYPDSNLVSLAKALNDYCKKFNEVSNSLDFRMKIMNIATAGSILCFVTMVMLLIGSWSTN